jgi:FKBP-type peptidyl-prolyl cis-trans isomerase SlyD
MKISKNKLVIFNYSLKDNHNNVVESSIGKDPVTYIHGEGHILPKLEAAFENRSKDDQFSVTLEPQDGYGEVIDDLIQTAGIDEFKDLEKIEKGEMFQVQLDTEEGVQTAVAKIIDVSDDNVTFDMNHPLAGQTITFDVTIHEVRDAAPEDYDTNLNPNAG